MYSSRDFSSMEIHFRGREPRERNVHTRARARIDSDSGRHAKNERNDIIEACAVTALELFFFLFVHSSCARAFTDGNQTGL